MHNNEDFLLNSIKQNRNMSKWLDVILAIKESRIVDSMKKIGGSCLF